MMRLLPLSFVILLNMGGSTGWAVSGNQLAMKSNGFNVGGDWILQHTGYVGTYITLAEPGSVTLAVEARGAAHNGVWPRMNLVVNDERAGWDVGSAYATYQHTFDLPAGTHFVRTEFANDLEKSARQLRVRNLDVVGATLSNSNTNSNALVAADTYIQNYRQGNVTIALQGATPGTSVDVSLRNHAFKFGTAVAGFNNSNNMNPNPSPGSNNYLYQQKLKEHFNALVPENAGKWQQNEFNQGQPWHPQLDRIIDFAGANDMALRMHNLIWDNQQPNWVENLLNQASSGNQTAKNQLRAAVSNRIQYYVADLAEHFYEIDVYNEMDHTPQYWNIFGAEGIADIYNEVAAAAGSHVGIATNEYNVLQDTGDFYGNWYKDKIEELIVAGGHVSAIGIQSYENNTPAGSTHWSAHSAYRKMQTLQNLSVLDIPLTLTEFGVKDDASQELAAQILDESLRLVFGTPQADGFYMWGFWGGSIWRGGAALYDANWNLTPAGQVWVDLMNEWDTQLTTMVAPDGTISFDGFWGDYEIMIDGEVFQITLEKDTLEYSLQVAEAMPGDFNFDGVVDGADFLAWQRGESPNSHSAGDLSTWQANFGVTSQLAQSQAVPEPSSLMVLLISGLSLLATRHTTIAGW